MTRYLIAACLALSVATGVQSWRLDRVKAELVSANLKIASLEAFEEAAAKDAQNQVDQCTARVNEARRSAQRIETIVEKPHEVDPSGCPVRSSIVADELRQALQPRPPA